MPYSLTGLVCYGSGHYQSYFQYASRYGMEDWWRIDDTKAMQLPSSSDLERRLVEGRQMPTMLIFRRGKQGALSSSTRSGQLWRREFRQEYESLEAKGAFKRFEGDPMLLQSALGKIASRLPSSPFSPPGTRKSPRRSMEPRADDTKEGEMDANADAKATAAPLKEVGSGYAKKPEPEMKEEDLLQIRSYSPRASKSGAEGPSQDGAGYYRSTTASLQPRQLPSSPLPVSNSTSLSSTTSASSPTAAVLESFVTAPAKPTMPASKEMSHRGSLLPFYHEQSPSSRQDIPLEERDEDMEGNEYGSSNQWNTYSSGEQDLYDHKSASHHPPPPTRAPPHPMDRHQKGFGWAPSKTGSDKQEGYGATSHSSRRSGGLLGGGSQGRSGHSDYHDLTYSHGDKEEDRLPETAHERSQLPYEGLEGKELSSRGDEHRPDKLPLSHKPLNTAHGPPASTATAGSALAPSSVTYSPVQRKNITAAMSVTADALSNLLPQQSDQWEQRSPQNDHPGFTIRRISLKDSLRSPSAPDPASPMEAAPPEVGLPQHSRKYVLPASEGTLDNTASSQLHPPPSASPPPPPKPSPKPSSFEGTSATYDSSTASLRFSTFRGQFGVNGKPVIAATRVGSDSSSTAPSFNGMANAVPAATTTTLPTYGAPADPSSSASRQEGPYSEYQAAVTVAREDDHSGAHMHPATDSSLYSKAPFSQEQALQPDGSIFAATASNRHTKPSPNTADEKTAQGTSSEEASIPPPSEDHNASATVRGWGLDGAVGSAAGRTASSDPMPAPYTMQGIDSTRATCGNSPIPGPSGEQVANDEAVVHDEVMPTDSEGGLGGSIPGLRVDAVERKYHGYLRSHTAQIGSDPSELATPSHEEQQPPVDNTTASPGGMDGKRASFDQLAVGFTSSHDHVEFHSGAHSVDNPGRAGRDKEGEAWEDSTDATSGGDSLHSSSERESSMPAVPNPPPSGHAPADANEGPRGHARTKWANAAANEPFKSERPNSGFLMFDSNGRPQEMPAQTIQPLGGWIQLPSAEPQPAAVNTVQSQQRRLLDRTSSGHSSSDHSSSDRSISDRASFDHRLTDLPSTDLPSTYLPSMDLPSKNPYFSNRRSSDRYSSDRHSSDSSSSAHRPSTRRTFSDWLSTHHDFRDSYFTSTLPTSKYSTDPSSSTRLSSDRASPGHTSSHRFSSDGTSSDRRSVDVASGHTTASTDAARRRSTDIYASAASTDAAQHGLLRAATSLSSGSYSSPRGRPSSSVDTTHSAWKTRSRSVEAWSPAHPTTPYSAAAATSDQDSTLGTRWGLTPASTAGISTQRSIYSPTPSPIFTSFSSGGLGSLPREPLPPTSGPIKAPAAMYSNSFWAATASMSSGIHDPQNPPVLRMTPREKDVRKQRHRDMGDDSGCWPSSSSPYLGRTPPTGYHSSTSTASSRHRRSSSLVRDSHRKSPRTTSLRNYERPTASFLAKSGGPSVGRR